MHIIFLVILAFIMIVVCVMIYGLAKTAKQDWKYKKGDIIFYGGHVYLIVGTSYIRTPTPSYLLFNSDNDSVIEEEKHSIDSLAILKSEFDTAVEEMHKLEHKISNNEFKQYKMKDHKL